MNDDFELNIGELRRKQGQAGGGAGRRTRTRRQWKRRESTATDEAQFDPQKLIEERTSLAGAPVFEPEKTRRWVIDPWRLVEAMRRHWKLVAVVTAFGAAIGFGIGYWKAPHKVYVDLIKNAIPAPAGSIQAAEDRPHEIPFETTASYLKDPDLLERVCLAAATNLLITLEELQKCTRLLPARNPDVVTLELKRTGSLKKSVWLVNLYAAKLTNYMMDIQKKETEVLNEFLRRRMESNQADIEKAKNALIAYSKNNNLLDVERESQSYLSRLEAIDKQYQSALLDQETLELTISQTKAHPGSDKLQEAHEKLEKMLQTMTEEHPDVVRQRQLIADLERKQKIASTNAGAAPGIPYSFKSEMTALEAKRMMLTNTLAQLKTFRDNLQTNLSNLSEKAVQFAILKGEVQSAQDYHKLLLNKQHETQLVRDNLQGYYRIFSPATPENSNLKIRWLMIASLIAIGAALGMITSTGAVLLRELTDDRIKTAYDVQRATRLPVLASLGDLSGLNPEQQVNWAFRTLTILKGKLNAANGHSLVCGFISAHHGEGRSTWIKLLVSAASQRGLRVLTVATRPANQPTEETLEPDGEPEAFPTRALTTLRRDALDYPSQVTDQLSDPKAQAVIHIPLPGWVWNLERRKQWQAALNQWRKIDNLVLLVELPPASQPEAILLAESVPQLIWLSASGMADTTETETHLETLRHAGCNLVGAVLNREPRSLWKNRVARWIGATAAGLLLASPAVARGAELRTFPVVTNWVQPAPAILSPAAPATAENAETNVSFSVVRGIRRSPWQERLTLGPGDVFNIYFYGAPDRTRTNVVVGPDGRLSYLLAQNVVATGLTIEDLRAKLDEQISRYYPDARTIVIPVAFNSKKYYVLGKVSAPGIYRLDRPITIVEAVARARGLETGLYERAPVELADLTRSFLVRNGHRLNINFEKLFLEGDLSQNIPLEPGDYLYFGSASLSQVYVLGQVFQPGVVGFHPGTTLVAAITAGGGFLHKAYKSKILVVRGSLQRPEPFVVDMSAILAARAPDFILQPRDIVYVSARPWAKIEELLDEAGQAFVESIVTTWTGVNIGPLITKPVVPSL